MTERVVPHPNPMRLRRTGGFTLTEALVAVFAIALISSGLAAIFGSVGETVERGRRISELNQYAAVIERQLRRDIESMTREGFLVIRNEYAGSDADPTPQSIRLSSEAVGSSRARRIDELMFFGRGTFETARTPIDPSLGVRANSARIYYGHGQQQLEGASGFFEPILDDPNADALLRLGLDSAADLNDVNPNFFAADWTLLRHATLLLTPERSYFSQASSFPNIDRFVDNELQIDFEPAADSVFRSLAFWGNPRPFGEDGDVEFEIGDDYADFSIRSLEVPPTFPSGAVDIATETLAAIKRRVTQIDVVTVTIPQFGGAAPDVSRQIVLDTPSAVFTDPNRRPFFVLASGDEFRAQSRVSPADFHDIRIDEARASAGGRLLLGEAERFQELVHMQHAWMADAMPGASVELSWRTTRQPQVEPEIFQVIRYGEGATQIDPFEPTYPFRTRMRYESTPPGYNAAVFGDEAATLTPNQLAGIRADQQMVATSQFIPRCTEFIVEWSFGERSTTELEGLLGVPAGELVWYGAPRADDAAFLAQLRPGISGTQGQNRPDAEPDLDGNGLPVPTEPNPLDEEDQRLLERHLLADLITGLPLTGTPSADQYDIGRFNSTGAIPTTYYFGYADPRAVPVGDLAFDDNNNGIIEENEIVANTGFDINGDGYRDDVDGDGVYDDAWPWPKLLRITLSFADPVDQTIEETFQLVFEVPQDGAF
ncbi:MAG: hypothetical protein AAGB48_02500 [Planctomycetota bacterium]